MFFWGARLTLKTWIYLLLIQSGRVKGDKEVNLPKLPKGAQTSDYGLTTNYHWDLFVGGSNSDYTTVDGPFQFGKGILLQKGQCQTKEGFHSPGDACIKDMKHCSKGFSMSVFVKISSEFSLNMLNSTKYKKEYLMSTGGDVGYPGAGIYMRGANLGALVSLGSEYWHVFAKGFLPTSNKWTNIGITWEKSKFSSEKEYTRLRTRGLDVGGLSLYVNGEKVAYSLLNRNCSSLDITDNNCTEQFDIHPAKDPPQISLGCHRLSNKNTALHVIKRPIAFDEPAIWNRALREDESALLSGGYKKSLENLSKAQLMAFLEKAPLENQEDFSSATSILKTLVHLIDNKDALGGNKTKLERILGLIDKIFVEYPFMLKGKKLSRMEVKALLSSVIPLVALIDMKGRFAEDWKALHFNSSKPNSHQLREKLEKYMICILDRLNPFYRVGQSLSEAQTKDWYTALSNGYYDPYEMNERLIPDLTEFYSDSNFAIQIMSIRVGVLEIRSISQRNQFKFPIWGLPAWEKSRRLWGETVEPAESAKIPLRIRDEGCISSKSDRVNFVMSAYDTFPDSENKNPSYFKSNQAILISRIISLKASHVPFRQSGHPCPLSTTNYNKSAILVTLSHKVSLITSLVFKKNPQMSRIKSIHCVMWNKAIGINGAWDVENVNILYSDQILSNCIAHKLGVYAIIAQLHDESSLPTDPIWLSIIKYVGHSLSIISLLIFLGNMFLSYKSMDMFHNLSLSLGSSLLGGHLFMVFSELDIVRNDLHSCSLAGVGLSFFYGASSIAISVKSYALFEAITSGIIGGRIFNYLSFTWGFGILMLGALLVFMGEYLGLDARCMINGFSKGNWIFLGSMISFSLVNFLIVGVALINVGSQVATKDNIVDEIESMTKTHAVFSLVYMLTWIWSPLALIPNLYPEGPNFYSAFEVGVSLLGLFFFMLDGLLSNKNRILLHKGGDNRRNQILKLANNYFKKK